MEDAQEAFECWESDPDVAKYMFWKSHNDVNKTVEWLEFETGKIAVQDWYRWGIVEKTSGKLIGTCLVYYEEEVSSYEVSYNLGKKFWGKGFITEAMKETIQFAKERLDIKEIVARHAKVNTASENVLNKLGFQYENDCPCKCNDDAEGLEGKMYRLKFS